MSTEDASIEALLILSIPVGNTYSNMHKAWTDAIEKIILARPDRNDFLMQAVLNYIQRIRQEYNT